eukprot:UN33867
MNPLLTDMKTQKIPVSENFWGDFIYIIQGEKLGNIKESINSRHFKIYITNEPKNTYHNVISYPNANENERKLLGLTLLMQVEKETNKRFKYIVFMDVNLDISKGDIETSFEVPILRLEPAIAGPSSTDSSSGTIDVLKVFNPRFFALHRSALSVMPLFSSDNILMTSYNFLFYIWLYLRNSTISTPLSLATSSNLTKEVILKLMETNSEIKAKSWSKCSCLKVSPVNDLDMS